MKTTGAATALIVIFTCGCATSQGASSGIYSPTDSLAVTPTASATYASGEPTPSSVQTGTVVPQPQVPGTCTGVTSVADAINLIESGVSSALVDVQITNDPGPVSLHTRVIQVQTAHLVAGQLPNGDVTSLEEAAANDSQNILPVGHYLLLLGRASAPGAYFLSDAYSGSFVVNGDGAFQQCARYGDPGVSLIDTGITSESGLEQVFQQAFASLASSSAPATAASTPS